MRLFERPAPARLREEAFKKLLSGLLAWGPFQSFLTSVAVSSRRQRRGVKSSSSCAKTDHDHFGWRSFSLLFLYCPLLLTTSALISFSGISFASPLFFTFELFSLLLVLLVFFLLLSSLALIFLFGQSEDNKERSIPLFSLYTLARS